MLDRLMKRETKEQADVRVQNGVAVIVKEERSPTALLERTEHLKALEELTERIPETNRPTISPDHAEKLRKAGFHWVVYSDTFVPRFPYAAVVSSSGRGTWSGVFVRESDSGSERQVIYTGDIPDFAIQRALIAKKLGIEVITIHSAAVLPVTLAASKVDPVLVGWLGGIHIAKNDPSGPYRTDRDGIIPGIVIALWDGDKEIAL